MPADISLDIGLANLDYEFYYLRSSSYPFYWNYKQETIGVVLWKYCCSIQFAAT